MVYRQLKNASYLFLVSFLIFLSSCQNQPTNKYIEWGSDNKLADELITKGRFHHLNAEWHSAHSYFKAAIDLDSTNFASYVVLAWYTPTGEMKNDYIKNAKKYVTDKNETSKLFVSTLDIAGGEGVLERRHNKWSEMHNIEPEGRFIHNYYASTKPTTQEQIDEFEVLLEKLKSSDTSNGRSYAHILNNLAYSYYSLDKKDLAKKYFEEYVNAYPGSNSYDSMGEFYYNEKDYEKSLKNYKKSLEYYSQSLSGNDKVRELEYLLKK